MANPYFIKIELPPDSGNGAVAGVGMASANSDTPKDDVSAQRLLNASKKLISFAAAVSTADKIISYNISQVSLRTGATEYEQRLNAAYSLGKQIVGAGAALAGGAIMGAPVGFTIAAIGVVSSGINQLISYEQRKQTLLAEQSLENISIGMQNVRAGITGRRSNDQ